jgi:hypothetical protein
VQKTGRIDYVVITQRGLKNLCIVYRYLKIEEFQRHSRSRKNHGVRKAKGLFGYPENSQQCGIEYQT